MNGKTFINIYDIISAAAKYAIDDIYGFDYVVFFAGGAVVSYVYGTASTDIDIYITYSMPHGNDNKNIAQHILGALSAYLTSRGLKPGEWRVDVAYNLNSANGVMHTCHVDIGGHDVNIIVKQLLSSTAITTKKLSLSATKMISRPDDFIEEYITYARCTSSIDDSYGIVSIDGHEYLKNNKKLALVHRIISEFDLLPARSHIVHKDDVGDEYYWPRHSTIGDLLVFAAPFTLSIRPDHYSARFWLPVRAYNKQRDRGGLINSLYVSSLPFVRLFKYLGRGASLAASDQKHDWWWWHLWLLSQAPHAYVPVNNTIIANDAYCVSIIKTLKRNDSKLLNIVIRSVMRGGRRSLVKAIDMPRLVELLDIHLLFKYQLYGVLAQLTSDGFINSSWYHGTNIDENSLKSLPDVTVVEVSDAFVRDSMRYITLPFLAASTREMMLSNIYCANSPIDVRTQLPKVKEIMARYAKISVDDLDRAFDAFKQLLYHNTAHFITNGNTTYADLPGLLDKDISFML